MARPALQLSQVLSETVEVFALLFTVSKAGEKAPVSSGFQTDLGSIPSPITAVSLGPSDLTLWATISRLRSGKVSGACQVALKGQ